MQDGTEWFASLDDDDDSCDPITFDVVQGSACDIHARIVDINLDGTYASLCSRVSWVAPEASSRLDAPHQAGMPTLHSGYRDPIVPRLPRQNGHLCSYEHLRATSGSNIPLRTAHGRPLPALLILRPRRICLGGARQ